LLFVCFCHFVLRLFVVIAALWKNAGYYIFALWFLSFFLSFFLQSFFFMSKSCVLYWQRYCTALQQRASANLWGVVQGIELRNFRRGRHLYLAERPSRWASAHISSLLYRFSFVITTPRDWLGRKSPKWPILYRTVHEILIIQSIN